MRKQERNSALIGMIYPTIHLSVLNVYLFIIESFLLEEYDSNRQQYNKLLKIHSQMNECINLNSLQSYEQFDSLMD